MQRVRIGTYNANNLFRRAILLEAQGMSQASADTLEDVQRLTELFAQPSYVGFKTEILELLKKYRFDKNGSTDFTINEIKGRLYKKSKSGLALLAKGRAEWVGGIELVTRVVNGVSSENTGRVICAAHPEILCIVEVEDRLALDQFNKTILKKLGFQFLHEMVVQGNDNRGINVGLCSKYEIRTIRSHVDDEYTTEAGKNELIFSRDCAEYEVVVPKGSGENGRRTGTSAKNEVSLWILCNHFKSQGFGTPQGNDAKRARQAERVREILLRFDLANQFIVVCGDFNAWYQNNHSIDALLKTPNLFDVLNWPKFTGPRWTYEDGKSQLDYLLVSKALFDKLHDVGIERRGILRKDSQHFPEVIDKVTQASDHTLVWAELDL